MCRIEEKNTNDKTQERAVWHTHKVRMPYAPAIEAMQAIVDLANDTITDPAYVIAAGMALDALKREAAEAANDPLTLEELREMDGDKIHIRYIGTCRGFYADEEAPYYGKYEQYVQKYNCMLRACDLPLKYYGDTWLAYRRKPDGGAK